VLRLPVRNAEPDKLTGLVDRIRTPAYSAGLGLLYWAKVLDEQSAFEGYSYGGLQLPKINLEAAADFFRRLLPG
jgi:cell division ATPase FtsA